MYSLFLHIITREWLCAKIMIISCFPKLFTEKVKRVLKIAFAVFSLFSRAGFPFFLKGAWRAFCYSVLSFFGKVTKWTSVLLLRPRGKSELCRFDGMLLRKYSLTLQACAFVCWNRLCHICNAKLIDFWETLVSLLLFIALLIDLSVSGGLLAPKPLGVFRYRLLSYTTLKIALISWKRDWT